MQRNQVIQWTAEKLKSEIEAVDKKLSKRAELLKLVDTTESHMRQLEGCVYNLELRVFIKTMLQNDLEKARKRLDALSVLEKKKNELLAIQQQM